MADERMRANEREAILGDVSARRAWERAQERTGAMFRAVCGCMLPGEAYGKPCPTCVRPVDKDAAVAAKHGQEFYHATERDYNGNAVRCRVSGKVKLWKRSPERFSLPCKYGMYDSLRIDETNDRWLTGDPLAHTQRFADLNVGDRFRFNNQILPNRIWVKISARRYAEVSPGSGEHTLYVGGETNAHRPSKLVRVIKED